MRKIEAEMVKAITEKRDFKMGNTCVEIVSNSKGVRADVYLHGNHIATVDDSGLSVDTATLRRWPSNTTKSRLRALGADVQTRKGITFLSGVMI